MSARLAAAGASHAPSATANLQTESIRRWILETLFKVAHASRRSPSRAGTRASKRDAALEDPLLMWIPDTVLFTRTQWQWLSSGPVDGDGRVRAHPFRSPGGGMLGGRPGSAAARGGNDYASVTSMQARNGTAVEADEVEMMREIRASFILDVAAKAGRPGESKWVQQKATDRTLCTAWFADGSYEPLTLASFDLLYHRAQWRSQLMALQAVVPVPGKVQDHYSVFIRRKHLEGRLFDDKREQQAAPKGTAGKKLQAACLEVHKELAVRLEGVALLDQIYEVEQREEEDRVADLSPRSPRAGRSGAAAAAKPKHKSKKLKRPKGYPEVRVTLLRSAFVIDSARRCWFVTSESGEVEHLPTAANAKDVDAAAKQLRALLAAATKRSVPMKECYKHFDEHSVGVVGRREFRRGMLRLGLKHPPTVHAALFVRIVALSTMRGAGAEPCFGMREFIKWCTLRPAGGVGKVAGKRRGSKATSTRSLKSVRSDAGSDAGSGAGCAADDEGGPQDAASVHSRFARGDAASDATSVRSDGAESTSSLKRIRENAREETKQVSVRTVRTVVELSSDDDDDEGGGESYTSGASARPLSAGGTDARSEYSGSVASAQTAASGPGGARTFSLANGETMRYQVLGAAAPLTRGAGGVPTAVAAVDGEAEAKGGEEESSVETQADAALRIVAFPGMFDSLATLIDFFQPLVATHVNWRILLLEFPNDAENARRVRRQLGQTGQLGYSDGGRREGLNNEGLAMATAQLLSALEARDGWSQDPLHRAAPVIFWGFGNGANVASALLAFRTRFLHTLQIGEPGVIRAAIFINGFLHSDVGQRRCLKRLLRMAENARHHERMQYLSSLLFSLEYLAEHGRPHAFAEFYRTRAPRGGTTEVDERVSGLARGALVHSDLRPHFRSMAYVESLTPSEAERATHFPVPVVAIAGTGNAFILPHATMEIVKHAQAPPAPERNDLDDLEGDAAFATPTTSGRPPTAEALAAAAPHEALDFPQWLEKVHLLSLLVEGVKPPQDEDADLSIPVALRGSLAMSAFVSGGHALLQEQRRFLVKVVLETAKATYVKHDIPPRVLLARREARRAMLKKVEEQRRVRARAARLGGELGEYEPDADVLAAAEHRAEMIRERERNAKPIDRLHDAVVEQVLQKDASVKALESKRDSELTKKLKAAAERRAKKEEQGDAFARAQAILERKREAAITREKEERAGRAERMLMVQVQKRKREARERRMLVDQLRGNVFKKQGLSRLRIEQRDMVAEDKLAREMRRADQNDAVWRGDAPVRDMAVEQMHDFEEKVLAAEELQEKGLAAAVEREEMRKKKEAARARFKLGNVTLPHTIAEYMLESDNVMQLVRGASLVRVDLDVTTAKKEEAMQSESGVNALLDNQRRGIAAKQGELKETMQARSMVLGAINTEETELQREMWRLQALQARKKKGGGSSDSSFDSEDDSEEDSESEDEEGGANDGAAPKELKSELTRELTQSVYEKRRVVVTLMAQEQELKNELAKLHVNEREFEGEAEKVRKVVLQSKFVMVELHKLVHSAITKLDVQWEDARAELLLKTTFKDEHSKIERNLRLSLEHAVKRRAVVDAEYERITRLLKRRRKNHKPTTFVDTAIWQEGIKQRVRSDEVLKFLTAERLLLEKSMQKDNDALTKEHAVIHDVAAVIERAMGQCLAMQNELHLLRTAWRMRQSNLAGEGDIDVAAQEEAKAAQQKREQVGAAALEARQAQQARELGLFSIAARIRAKTHDQRTVEEREWATIDRLVNADLYPAPSRYETLQLRKRTEDLSIAKLKQIAKLPTPLQEALAYLDSEAEIRAHRLICKFTHETDVAKMEAADQRSTRVARQRQAAWVRHTPPELLTNEERQWLAIDAKLRPYVYPRPQTMSVETELADRKWAEELRHALSEAPLKVTLLPPKLKKARQLVEMYAPMGDGPAPPAVRKVGGSERPAGAGCDAAVVSCLADVPAAYKSERGVVPVKVRGSKSVTLVRIGCPPISEAGRLRGEEEPDPKHARVLARPVTPLAAVELDDTGTLSLELRQRRSHHFVLSAPVSELRITIMVRGVVDARGYIPGRLSASLYRHLPERFSSHANADGTKRDPSAESGAIAVGFTDHSDVTICTLKSMGRLVIRHRPGVIPIPQGNYEIAVVAASKCSYSITVTAKLVYSVEEHIEEVVQKHRRLAARLPVAEKECDEISTTIRLGLRKLKMAKRLLGEAEERVAQILDMRESLRGLISDPEERDELTDIEAAEAIKRFSELEQEFAVWQRLVDGRKEEVDDIQTGLTACAEPRVKIIRELSAACDELRKIREEVPAAIAALAGCSLRRVSDDDWEEHVGTRPGGLRLPQWAIKALTAVVPWTHTPAATIRRKTFAACTAKERRFRKLDKILRPWHWTHEDGGLSEVDEVGDGEDETPGSPKSPSATVKADAMVLLQEEQAQVNDKFGSHDDEESDESVDLGADPNAWTTDKSGEIGALSKMAMQAKSGDYAQKQLSRLFWCPMADLTDTERKDRALMIDTHNRIEWIGVFNVARLRQIEIDAKVKKPKSKEAWAAMKEAEAGKILSAEERAERESQQAGEFLGERCLKKRPIHRSPEEREWARYHRLIRPKLYEGAKEPQVARGTIRARGMVDGLVGADLQRILKQPAARLRSALERRVQYLLLKYRCRDTFMGATAADRAAEHERMKENGELTMDIDTRVRQVLREVDRAIWCTKRMMDSSVYHRALQRFPTRVLRLELQRYLDELLLNQIKERELELKRQALSQWARERNADLITDLYQGDDVELLSIQFGGPGPNGLHPAEVPAYTIEAQRKRLELAVQESTPDDEGVGAEGVGAEEADDGDYAQPLAPWRATDDLTALVERKDELAEELAIAMDHLGEPGFEMAESTVLGSAQRGGRTRMPRLELIQDLKHEIVQIDERVRMQDVDKELHYAFSATEDYIEVRTLHGFAQQQFRMDAITALEHERTVLMAKVVANEVVDTILNWMLEGWHFGERAPTVEIAGFVPSIKKDGPLRFRHSRAITEAGGLEQLVGPHAGLIPPGLSTVLDIAKESGVLPEGAEPGSTLIVGARDRDRDSVRGTLETRWDPIAAGAAHRAVKKKWDRKREDTLHQVNNTETTLKFGVFSLTLMYFRALYLLKKQKATWSGANDVLETGAKPQVRDITETRRQMEQTQIALKRRSQRTADAEAKAAMGQMRRQARLDSAREEARLNLRGEVMRRHAELQGSRIIQRIFRGHVGRRVAKRWAIRQSEARAVRFLRLACSIAIQRVYRGHVDRVLVQQYRVELADFVLKLRADEATKVEEEYWKDHKAGALKHKIMEKLFKKKRKPFVVPKWLIAAEQMDHDDVIAAPPVGDS